MDYLSLNIGRITLDLISPLRLARLKKGYSQQGLAFLTGIPQVQISYAERGYFQALKSDQWKKLSQVLGCDLKEIAPIEVQRQL
jgi:transcriptional regulator with XRE-family HTH domain